MNATPTMTSMSTALESGQLRILLYHGVTDARSEGIENYSCKHIGARTFRRQLEYLRLHCHVLSMDAVVAHHRSGEPFPRNAAVISFDDGFRNNYTVAAPLLEEYRLPAVFYVAAGVVNTDMMFWVDKLEDCLNRAAPMTLKMLLGGRDRRFELHDRDSRIVALEAIKGHCKRCSSAEKDEVVEQLIAQTRVTPRTAHARNYEKLSWRELREMANHDLFTIGGHSLYHDILAALPDGTLEQDIGLSIDLLEYNLGVPIRHYSYPEGQEYHYDERVIRALKGRDIVCSPSAIDGVNDVATDLFHLRRCMVGFMDRPFGFAEPVESHQVAAS